jgi:hypothetical protein
VELGRQIQKQKSWTTVALAALASSLFFYFVTNFAVWAFGPLYPRTGAGLIACYTAAIPFFRNSLAGDLFYTATLFGGFALLQKLVRSLREDRQSAPAY